MVRVLFIKIPHNKTIPSIRGGWTAVVCVNNKAFARCFPHLFCEGYGNTKIRVPVTDELFLDLALHWTLYCTCVLQTRRDRLDYGRRVITGFGTSLITARGRATRALLSPRASIVRRVSCIPWIHTWIRTVWCVRRIRREICFLRGKYGSPEESFSPRQ